MGEFVVTLTVPRSVEEGGLNNRAGDKGDVGVNANHLSQSLTSLISSSLAIRFTEDVVIPKNRATDAHVYPNFLTAT